MAEDYNFSFTVNPESFVSGSPVSITGPTFSLSDGDTISGTVTFTYNEFFNVQNTKSSISYLDLQFSSVGNPNAYFTSSVDLQNFSGVGLNESTPGQANGTVSAVILEPDSAKYSFSGFTYLINITSIPDGTATSPEYVGLYLPSGTVDSVTFEPLFVPEPSVWLLLLGGLLLLSVGGGVARSTPPCM